MIQPVLDFENSNFGIVSHFDIRHSDFFILFYGYGSAALCSIVYIFLGYIMMTNLIFRRFTVGSFGINGYLVADPETRIGVFIDPGGFSAEIEAFIQEQQILLNYLFFTHGHWDHTEGLPEFESHYTVQGYAGQGEVSAANYQLRGGEMIEVGHLRFEALSVPGHTPHGISFYGSGCVFTGDTLMCGSVGGTGSTKDAQCQITHIRKHIFALPDETLVFPAHGPITTVGVEKYTNPFCY